MKTPSKVREEAALLTEATHKLCVALAKELNADACPIPANYKTYSYPVECRIMLYNNKVLDTVPMIAIKIISHKPTHIKVRGIYPVSSKAGAFTPLSAPLAVTTANRTKPIRLLARQIRGKFMETFLPVLENCILDMRSAERRLEMAEAEAALMRAIIGNKKVSSGYPSTILNVYNNEENEHLKVECLGGKVVINWTCNADKAASFARLYQELADKKGTDGR